MNSESGKAGGVRRIGLLATAAMLATLGSVATVRAQDGEDTAAGEDEGVVGADQGQSVDEDFELEEDAENRDVTSASAAETGEDIDLMDDDMAASRVDDEQALVEEQVGVEQSRSTLDPYEEDDTGYFFLGGFYRHTFQPEWLLNWFFERSEGTNNPGGGLELTFRRNSFSIVASVWYQTAFVEGYFQANGDPIDEIEYIDSDLSVLFASATFLWSTDFNDVFAFEYGVGIGLGAVFGELRRTEAYPVNFEENGSTGGPYARCDGPASPLDPDDGGPQFCDSTSVDFDENGGHFDVKEGRWSEGGDIPNIFPWLAFPPPRPSHQADPSGGDPDRGWVLHGGPLHRRLGLLRLLAGPRSNFGGPGPPAVPARPSP